MEKATIEGLIKSLKLTIDKAVSNNAPKESRWALFGELSVLSDLKLIDIDEFYFLCGKIGIDVEKEKTIIEFIYYGRGQED